MISKKNKRVQITMDKNLFNRVKNHLNNEVNMTSYITWLIINDLNNHKKEEN